MSKGGAIIGLQDWLKTPAGRYVLAWEQGHLDAVLADVFGFHALQLGLPELDALHANRMPHRWLAVDSLPEQDDEGHAETDEAKKGEEEEEEEKGVHAARTAVALACDFEALPFESASLDLVVLPHSLELARDPHLALREVERVLVPEGRAVIVGFNPASLWGVRQRLGRLWRRVAPRRSKGLFLPATGDFMRYRRLRDWLRLLSFEVEAGRFGCYRPPAGSHQWLARFEWIERLGERWWPVFGAVYFVVAVKRVRGMRLVGLARSELPAAHPAPAPAVAARRRSRIDEA